MVTIWGNTGHDREVLGSTERRNHSKACGDSLEKSDSSGVQPEKAHSGPKWLSTEPSENAPRPVSLKPTRDLASSNQKYLPRAFLGLHKWHSEWEGIYTPGQLFNARHWAGYFNHNTSRQGMKEFWTSPYIPRLHNLASESFVEGRQPPTHDRQSLN